MSDIKKGKKEQPINPTELDTAESAILQEVEEIKEAVSSVVTETSLTDKVEDLRYILDNLSEEVESWRKWHKNTYLEVIETLKSQVEEIQGEWNNVSGSMQTQREKLESLLQSFPGVIETSTLKALSLRVAHLEQLVSQLFQESSTKSNAIRTRRQLIISIMALGVTIVLWGVFLVINLLK